MMFIFNESDHFHGQQSRHSSAGCSTQQLLRLQSRRLAWLCFFLKLRVLFQACGCWQNLVPCSVAPRLPFSCWLSAKDHFQQLRLLSDPCYVAVSIGSSQHGCWLLQSRQESTSLISALSLQRRSGLSFKGLPDYVRPTQDSLQLTQSQRNRDLIRHLCKNPFTFVNNVT